MRLHDTPKMFGAISIFLHWLTAIFVIFLLLTGVYSLYLKWFVTGERAAIMILHLFFGAISIPFMIWRVYWRVRSGHPEEPRQTPLLTWLTAVNWPLILILIVVIYVTGPFLSWLYGNPLFAFGVPFHPPFWPRWVQQMADIRDGLVLPLHGYASLALGFLLFFHIAGALKHWIVDRDRVLPRMIRPQPLDGDVEVKP